MSLKGMDLLQRRPPLVYPLHPPHLINMAEECVATKKNISYLQLAWWWCTVRAGREGRGEDSSSLITSRTK